MGITAILAEYEPEIIRKVTDPREGIARKLKWMPTIAELSEECEKAKATMAAYKYMIGRGFALIDGIWTQTGKTANGENLRSA